MQPGTDPDPTRTARCTTRRWVLFGLLTAGAAALAGGVSVFGGRARHAWAASRAMMGTTATVIVVEASRARAEAAVDAAFTRMEAVAGLMTRFDAASDVGRINATPGDWIPVDGRTARVIAEGLSYARASDGLFDPALDHLAGAWGLHGSLATRSSSTAADLEHWRNVEAYRSVAVGGTAEAPAVRLSLAGVGLDLGGIAKGFAVDEGVAALREAGIRHALVEAGGDLYAMGRGADGNAWPVGVRDPRNARKLLTTLRLSDEAAATSGDPGVRPAGDWAHLGVSVLNPRTGRLATHLQSATVRAPSAMAADALATLACAADPLRLATLSRLGARGWVTLDAQHRLQTGPA